MILRAFVDTLPAHHAVNSLHIFFFPLRVYALNSHRAGMVAGPAFRAGSTVFFEPEQIKSFQQSHQIPQRADDTPKSFYEKASY